MLSIQLFCLPHGLQSDLNLILILMNPPSLQPDCCLCWLGLHNRHARRLLFVSDCMSLLRGADSRQTVFQIFPHICNLPLLWRQMELMLSSVFLSVSHFAWDTYTNKQTAKQYFLLKYFLLG